MFFNVILFTIIYMQMTYNFFFHFRQIKLKLPKPLRNLEKCIADIDARMKSNSLQLNHSKCEFMLFGSKSQLNKLDIDSISISGNDIPLSNSCRNLGVIFDSKCLCRNKPPVFANQFAINCAILAYPKIPHSFCYRETCPLAHFLPP